MKESNKIFKIFNSTDTKVTEALGRQSQAKRDHNNYINSERKIVRQKPHHRHQ